MARITYAKIRKGSIRELGLKAVIDGAAAGDSYDEICNAINVACFAGKNIARARRRYTWAFVKCSNEDGTNVCPPPPAKSAMTKPEVAAASASIPATEILVNSADLADEMEVDDNLGVALADLAVLVKGDADEEALGVALAEFAKLHKVAAGSPVDADEARAV